MIECGETFGEMNVCIISFSTVQLVIDDLILMHEETSLEMCRDWQTLEDLKY